MIKQLMFKAGRWMLAHSGNAGADAWTALQVENQRLEAVYNRQLSHLRLELAPLRHTAKILQELHHDLTIVDSMISAGEVDGAQKYLRVALIKARRPVSVNDAMQAGLAGLAAQQNNALGAGLFGQQERGGMNQYINELRELAFGRQWP